MPQQKKALVQQGAIIASKDNLFDSIDEAIVHFQDSETQRVLKKYGFDVNSIIGDLNESKILTSQISNQSNDYTHDLESLFIEGWSLDKMSMIQQITSEINSIKNGITPKCVDDASKNIANLMRTEIITCCDNNTDINAAPVSVLLSNFPILKQKSYDQLKEYNTLDINYLKSNNESELRQRRLQICYNSMLSAIKPS
jgi:hypothetical protein